MSWVVLVAAPRVKLHAQPKALIELITWRRTPRGNILLGADSAARLVSFRRQPSFAHFQAITAHRINKHPNFLILEGY